MGQPQLEDGFVADVEGVQPSGNSFVTLSRLHGENVTFRETRNL